MLRLARLPVLVLVSGLTVLAASAWVALPAAAQTIAACPSGASIAVSPPAAGTPTTVTVNVTPTLNLKAATAGDASSFHLHYFVDTAATAAGSPIPTDNPKIIHSAATSQDLGALTAGSHTVTVVLGQLNHVACDTRGSVTFTVAQQATPAASATATASVVAPRTGGAGLMSGDGNHNVATALSVLTAVALLAGGRATTRKERGY